MGGILTFSKTTQFGHYFVLEALNDLFDNRAVSTLAQGTQILLQKGDIFQVPDEALPMKTT